MGDGIIQEGSGLSALGFSWKEVHLRIFSQQRLPIESVLIHMTWAPCSSTSRFHGKTINWPPTHNPLPSYTCFTRSLRM